MQRNLYCAYRSFPIETSSDQRSIYRQTLKKDSCARWGYGHNDYDAKSD